MKKIFLPFIKNDYNLESKWWHRLFKVIFIVVVGGLLIYLCTQDFNKYSLMVSMTSLDNEVAFVPQYGEIIVEGSLTDEKLSSRNNLNNIWLKQLYFDLIWNFLSIYFLSLGMQFLYYQVFLYIIYGKE